LILLYFILLFVFILFYVILFCCFVFICLIFILFYFILFILFYLFYFILIILFYLFYFIILYFTLFISQFLPNGNLFSYLTDKKNQLDDKLRIKWFRGIASGMLHLSFEGIVHRDLAARNVLLREDLDPKIRYLRCLCFRVCLFDLFLFVLCFCVRFSCFDGFLLFVCLLFCLFIHVFFVAYCVFFKNEN
jgi:hypothetical protein